MIIEELGIAITNMNDLKNKETVMQDATIQTTLRGNVVDLEEKIHLIIDLLIYLKDSFGYVPFDDMINSLSSITTNLREAIKKDNSIDREKFGETKQQFNSFQQTMRTEWVSIYSQIAGNKRGFLKAIESLHVVDGIAIKIGYLDDARGWPLDKQKFKRLKKALSSVDEITETLNIGEEAQSFLEKVNRGEASIVDLSPSVLAWLKDNNLESKMKLSF